jgi:hypothetical protein
MAKHMALCPNCGEILIVHVQAMVGGSVQENVGVSYIAMPSGLDEAGQQRFLASFRGDYAELEYNAAVAAWGAKWYPDRVATLAIGTGIVEITSLSVTPLQLALDKGASVVLGSEPPAIPVAAPSAVSQPAATPPVVKVSPQSVKLSAAATLGATSLEVEKFTPAQHWPVGTSVNAKAAREAAATKAKLALDVAKADAAVELAMAAAEVAKERADWEAAHPKPVTVEQALADKAKAEKALAAASTPTSSGPAPTPTPGDPAAKAAAIAAATARVQAADTALATATTAVPFDQSAVDRAQSEKTAADQALVNANALV